MIPIPVPQSARDALPLADVTAFGPPPGIPSSACGTIEAQVEVDREFGAYVFRVFWRPDDADLELLQAGAPVEVALWGSALPMHSVAVREDPQ